MFGAVLTLAAALLHVYVFGRAATVPALTRRIPRRGLFGIGGAMWAGFALVRLSGHGRGGALAETLDSAGLYWLATLFLIATCLLAVDLGTGFGWVLRRPAATLRGWALVAGVGLSAVALVQGLRPPVVDARDVFLKGLPPELDGTVIVALSDLHLGSALDRQWARDRAAQVRAQQPDLVVLLGDLVEGHGDAEAEHLSAFAGLGAPLGVWAVSGNHEAHNGGLRETALTGSGIRLLRNRWVQLRPGLVLAGVEDLTQAGRNGGGTKPLTQALAGRPPETATVLLSHTPWHADQAAREGVGLMLSGHTHGGQIWPFGYLVRIRYPFLEGRYTEQGMTVLVSRGTGTWGPRMRLWRPGQILRVTLRRGTSPVPAA